MPYGLAALANFPGSSTSYSAQHTPLIKTPGQGFISCETPYTKNKIRILHRSKTFFIETNYKCLLANDLQPPNFFFLDMIFRRQKDPMS